MYGISISDVPIVNKYVFNFYCEDKEALELFSKAFKEFVDNGGTVKIENDNSFFENT